MKLKYFFQIGLKNFLKNKSNKYNCIFIILPLVVMIVSLSIYKTFSVFINNDNYNNILHRVLFVYSSESTYMMEKKLSKIKEVSQVSNSLNFTSGGYVKEFLSNDFTGEIFIYGLEEENLPKITNGNLKKYSNDNDGIYIICPNTIYPDTSISDDKNWKKKTGIFTSQFFGKKINLSREQKIETIEIEIIATYDTKENNATQYQCYSSPANNIKINNFFSENRIQDNFSIAIVDKFTNINSVQKKINELGYESSTIQDDMTFFANNILRTGVYIFFIIFVISLVLIYISYSKNLYKRNKEIYLFRIIGYTKKNTSLIFNFECFLTGIISWLIAIIISIIIINVYGIYLHNISIGNSKIDILYSYNSLILTLLFSIALPILAFNINFTLGKESLIEKMKDNN